MTRFEGYQLRLQEKNEQLLEIRKELRNLSKDKRTDNTKLINDLEGRKKILLEEVKLLKDDFINNISFKVDEDLKVEYLKQKPLSTAKSDYPTIMNVDEYEVIIGKPVYNFSLAERDEMIMMKFKNSTIGAVNSTVSKIKGYVDFCVREGAVRHNQNIFDTLTKAESQKFVSKQATELRYITREQLQEFQDILENPQDKLLLELPYIGVRGRTVKGGTLEEIINLQIEPDSQDTTDCIIELERNDGTSRDLYVSSKTMGLILSAYYSEEYVANNGVEVEGKLKTYKINRYKNYVLCAIGNRRIEQINPTTINARFQKIQAYCNNPFITIHNLYISGMITRAIDIYKEKGEVTAEDYLKICKDFKYGITPDKYYYKVKQDVEKYLQGGIKNA
jgi:hypothetical protein